MRKSNVAGLLTWALYTVGVGGAFLGMTVTLSTRMHSGEMIGLAVGIGLLVIGGGLVLGGYRAAGRIKRREGNRIISATVESLLLVSCLFGMAAVGFLGAKDVPANEAFEMAKVVSEPFAVTAVHGSYRLYLYLLHSVLLLLGNKVAAGVLMQMILQVIAALFLYFAVRKLSGASAAMVMLVFFGFSPYLLTATMELSPFSFFMAFYGLAVWYFSGISERWSRIRGRKDMPFFLADCLVTGFLIGFCCYLDAAGITLLFLLAGSIWRYEVVSKRTVEAFLCCLLFAVLGFVGMHGIGGWNEETWLNSLRLQWELCRPSGFRIPIMVFSERLTWDVPVLLSLMAIGIFSSFFTKDMRGKGMWLWTAMLLMGMQCFGMVFEEPVDTFAIVYLFCAVMAGYNVLDIFKLVLGQEGKVERGMNGKENAERENKIAENEKDDGMPAFSYIENPLPLPKKHVSKVMDYDYPVKDDDDFDI